MIKKPVFIYSATIAGLILLFLDLHIAHSDGFLKSVLTKDMLTLSALYALRGFLSMVSTVNVSVGFAGASVGQLLSPLVDIVDKGINFFVVSNAILAFMVIVLTVCKSVIFKVLLLAAVAAAVIKKSRKIGIRLSLLFLMLNPGLPAYVMFTELIYRYAIPDNSAILNEKVTNLKNSFSEFSQAQGARANASGLGKVLSSLINESISGVLEILLTFFASMMLLFFVLPIGTFYIMRISAHALIKQITDTAVNDTPTSDDIKDAKNNAASQRNNKNQVKFISRI